MKLLNSRNTSEMQALIMIVCKRKFKPSFYSCVRWPFTFPPFWSPSSPLNPSPFSLISPPPTQKRTDHTSSRKRSLRIPDISNERVTFFSKRSPGRHHTDRNKGKMNERIFLTLVSNIVLRSIHSPARPPSLPSSPFFCPNLPGIDERKCPDKYPSYPERFIVRCGKWIFIVRMIVKRAYIMIVVNWITVTKVYVATFRVRPLNIGSRTQSSSIHRRETCSISSSSCSRSFRNETKYTSTDARNFSTIRLDAWTHNNLSKVYRRQEG